MGANIWFWLVYVLCVIFGGFVLRPWGTTPAYGPTYGLFIAYLLIGLLGWGIFGSPIH